MEKQNIHILIIVRIQAYTKKIEISKKKFGENFERLANYIFDDNNEYKINNERNEILHGSNINNFTAERCYWIFIWITSILSFIEKNT